MLTLMFLFFDGAGGAAPYSPDFKSWEDLLAVRSRNRPRDAIQLVNRLARTASDDHQRPPKITEEIFQAVIPSFSEEIAEDYAKEVVLECPQMLEILRTFSQIEYDAGSFTLSADRVKAHMLKVPTMFGITLYGLKISHNNEEQMFELWSFLFTSGFLNARVSDDREKDGYRHLNPLLARNLVSKPRWNEVQAILWEVNTAYRDFLISVQQDKAHRFGIAAKPKRPRGRR